MVRQAKPRGKDTSGEEQTVRVKGHARSIDGSVTYVKPHERRTAKGIPDRDLIKKIPSKPGTWSMTIQSHEADRAGHHYDLRLGIGKDAHSWALRYLPAPGEARLAVQQPTHTAEYMKWEGVISDGYGKGKVSIHDKGKVEVVEASDDKIVFNRFRGKRTDEFVLIRTKGKNWIILNRSTTVGKYSIPQYKPKYKEEKYSDALAQKEGLMQPKIDGAHAIVILEEGQRPRVFSYRRSKLGIPLEYTHKIKGLYAERVPKGFGKKVLRAEVYLEGKDGRPESVERTAAVLNSGVENSRLLQEGTNGLKLFPFDIEGDDRPHEQKMKDLHSMSDQLPYLRKLPYAVTPREKRKMIEKIREGKHSLTAEGLILWSNSGQPIKSKIVEDRDVYVRGVFPGKGKYKGKGAGGFYYSLTPRGPIKGKVGTGLSDKERVDLLANQSKVNGAVATVAYNRVTSTGALFGPRFIRWHLEKNQ